LFLILMSVPSHGCHWTTHYVQNLLLLQPPIRTGPRHVGVLDRRIVWCSLSTCSTRYSFQRCSSAPHSSAPRAASPYSQYRLASCADVTGVTLKRHSPFVCILQGLEYNAPRWQQYWCTPLDGSDLCK
jgi:hypothetical protein